MKKWKSIITAASLSLFASLTTIGFGGWIIAGSKTAQYEKTADSNAKKVAYITQKNITTYFTTVEKALETAKKDSAANTVYLIPGANPIITKDCEIAQGDTLCLPYENETWDFREGKTKLRNRFADDCDESIAQNRKNLVTIKRGVVLTVNGTLNIGGVLGNASSGYQGLQGQTSGSYCEILMEAGNEAALGAKIDVNAGGSIDCRGYIKESIISEDPNIQPRLTLEASSSLSLPFVIYDYQGASATGGIYCGDYSVGLGDLGKTLKPEGKACPFVLFDMPNIQISTLIKAGANVTGLVSLHTDEKTILGVTLKESWNADSFSLVGGTNPLLSIASGYIKIKYKPSNLGYTEVIRHKDNPTKTTVDIYGKCMFGSMKMTLNAQVANVEINTASVLFPFSYRWAFNVRRGGNVEIGHGIKFMNGCSLTVDDGGKLNLLNGGKVIFYNKTWMENKTTIPYDPTYILESPSGTLATLQNMGINSSLIVKTNTPLIGGMAKYLNNGVLNVAAGASIGAFVHNDSTAAALSLASGFTDNVQSLETNGTGGRDGLSFVFHPSNSQTITENAEANLINDFTTISKSSLPHGTFEGVAKNGRYGFGTRNGAPIIVGDNGINLGETKTYSVSDEGSHSLADNFVWSCSDESLLTLSSHEGTTVTATAAGSGEVVLTCDVYYKGSKITSLVKNITVGYYAYASVSVNTDNILDNKENPFAIGGIRDNRDIIVKVETNCTNYQLTWAFDSSKLALTSSNADRISSSYRFTAAGAGTDTLTLNFASNEMNKASIWSQEISIADNLRVTSIGVNPSEFSGNAGAWSSKDFVYTAELTTDGNLGAISYDYVSGEKSDYAKVTSISFAGNQLTLNCKGQEFAYQTQQSKFFIYSNNGVNGATVKSNELTFEVH